MLYIWPLFTFFSGPLLLPVVSPFLDIVRNAYSINFNHRGTIPRDPHEPAGSSSRLPSHYRRDPKKRPSAKGESTTPPGPDSSSFSLQAVDALVRSKLYYIPYFLSTLLASFLIVHYNTIIHPFTLADNRHYMFYVFRYTIRRPGNVRYYLIPAYTFCRLSCWACLSGSTLRLIDSQDQPAPVRFWSRPFADAPATARAGEQHAEEQAAARPPPMLPHVGMLDSPDSGSALAPPTSAAALWLLATALSLVTAPLVEPRYFILPWVFWRLLVPANRRLSTEPLLPGWLRRLAGKVDLRLVLETAWFVAVNLGTMYIFVTRPFVWRSEGGEVLDGGRVQRFMW
jgi:alpha-1,2-glucosyltransferase